MKKKVNNAIIGSFVVGAVVLVVFGILIFGAGDFLAEKSRHVMFFDESVKGLSVGAPVTFQGVKVGSVTSIQVRIKTDDLSFLVPVFIEIETRNFKPYGKPKNEFTDQEIHSIFIARGLRARLGLQSLVTGQLQVEIGMFPDTPINLVGFEPEFTEIPTIPTTVETLYRMLEDFPIQSVLNKLVNSLDGIEKLTNSDDLHDGIADLAASIRDLRHLAKTLDAKAGPLMAETQRTIASTNTMVANLDRRAAKITTGVDETLNEVQDLIRNIDVALTPIEVGVKDTAKVATATLEQAKRSMAVLEAFFDGNTTLSYNINQTLTELEEAIRHIRNLADYFERHPEALVRGKDSSGGE